MLRAILIVVGATVAGIWAICAYLYFSPLESTVDDRRAHSPQDTGATSSIWSLSPSRKDAPPPIATTGAGVPPTAQAGSEATAHAPQADPLPAPGIAAGAGHDEEAKRRALDIQARIPETPAPVDPTPQSKPASQYTALGGYILDGDSVIVAPPTTAEGPGSAAERRRQARLSMDLGKLP